MKKVFGFFRKHKIATIVSLIVILAAVCLTAVTIALWDKEEEADIIYNIPTNPAEKYIEYYAMTPNSASSSGYDYYPLSRVPSELVSKVSGLAVSRYDGYATEVEIPESATVSVNNATAVKLPVLHILASYSANVDNGLVGKVNSVILPDSITYVAEGALNGINVYVKGGITYTMNPILVNNENIRVTSGDAVIDTLVYKNGYYYSTTSLDVYQIVDGRITYISKYPEVKLNDSVVLAKATNTCDLIYIEANNGSITYENEALRKNSVSYTLDGNDLFGNTSGFMYSDNMGSYLNYYTYVVVGATKRNITAFGKTIELAAAKKYKIYYDIISETLSAEAITYTVGESTLLLDTDFIDYERYVSNGKLTLDANATVVEVVSLSKGKEYLLANEAGTYELTYAPDVVYTDYEDVTNYSLNDDYYLLPLDTSTESHYVEVEKEDGLVKEFNATSFVDGSILGNVTSYNVAFDLPEADCVYYADFGEGLVKLTYLDGLYLANRNAVGKVVIFGYKNENKVYESVEFNYKLGYLYNLNDNKNLDPANYHVTVKEYPSSNSEFEVVLDSRLGLSSVTVTITASYYDTFNDYKLVTLENPITITKNLTNNHVVITKDDFDTEDDLVDDEVSSILKNATILTNEYDFEAYEIKVNGVVVYSYIDDYYSSLDFYKRSYQLTYLTEEVLSGKVSFNCNDLFLNDCIVSIDDNLLTINETMYTYTEGAIKFERNYANTLDEEFYAEVSESGWYVVSSSSSYDNAINSSYINVSEAGLVYYSETGYKENKYSIYTLDDTFVSNMVYENGSAYAYLPTFDGPFGYYVVDSEGKEVARYISNEGYKLPIFDNYLIDESGEFVDIPLLATDTGYVADNVYLKAGWYSTKNGSFDVNSDGYYNVKDYGMHVTANPSASFNNSYSIKVGDASYQLYPTVNPSIQVAHIYDVLDNSQIILYDAAGLIVTTYQLTEGGSYKLYVNVSNYNVPSDKGWVNNYFNFIDVKNVSTFKLVEYGPTKRLEVVSKSLDSNNFDSYSTTTKFETVKYSTNQELFHHLSDGMYVGLINGYGKYDLIGSELEINLPVHGTYLVYTDGQMLDISRVEGKKQYYISFDNVKYQKMLLNIANNNYEEYIITNYSIASDITKVYIKDDLGNVSEHDINLVAGLYSSIKFAVDNRRRENGYDVFVNISGDRYSDDETKLIYLNNGTSTINYYVLNDDENLPEYSNVFNLTDYQKFIGWYTDSTHSTLYDCSGLTEGATYYAYVIDGLAYIYASQSALYTITTVDGNPVKLFAFLNDRDISFKVNTSHTIKEVNVGGLVLTPNDGVYTFNTTNVTIPATINVILLQPSVVVTLNNSDDSLVSTFNYEVGTYQSLPLPSNASGFIYYYDKATGIVYTDNTGRTISPYMIDSNITLTAAYSNSYYVTVNKIMPDGSVVTSSSQAYASGANVVNTFPRIDNYHYSSIASMMTTNGYPVEYNINEYLHNYSFTMPNSNVIININYVENTIETLTDLNEITKDIYVLVPTSMATDVKIFDAATGNYEAMIRVEDGKQIYPNYVVYSYAFDTAVNKFKVNAAGYDSYVYDINSENDVYIIENLSLENEVCHLSKWVNYDKTANSYTFDRPFTSVHMIHGDVSVDEATNTVTVVEAISIATHDNYQYASFEVVYVEDDVKMSYVVHYTAYGTAENPIIIGNGDSFKEYIGNAKFRYKENVHFVQTADILVEDSNGYEVVYNQEKPFEHTYNGGGHTIKYVQSEIRNNVNNGLFGYIGMNGTVKNFVLDYELTDQNSNYGYETKYYLGSICSINLGTVSDVTTTAYTLSCNNVRFAGGLVAHNVGTIQNCTNNISMKFYNHGPAESRIVGGIAGFNGGYGNGASYEAAKILNCINNGVVILEGETGREQYVDEIAALNKGTISNTYSTYNVDAEKHHSGSHRLYINGEEVYMYKTLNDNPGSNGEIMDANYMATVSLKTGDVITVKVDGEQVDFVGKVDGITHTKTSDTITSSVTDVVDIYYSEWHNNGYYWNQVWFEDSKCDYQLQIKNPNQPTRYIPLHSNPGAWDRNQGHVKEYMMVSVNLIDGDTVSVLVDGSIQQIAKITSGSKITSLSSGSITVNASTQGSYDFYYKAEAKEMYIGSDSCGPQKVKNDSIKVAVVDDWFFIDELRSTDYGIYHFESAMHVEYFNSKGESLGTMIYNNAQTYQYNGLNTVLIDVLENTTQIEVCRVMLISSRETGDNMWYYSFDGYKFDKIGNAFTSYPINKDKTNKTYSTGKISTSSIEDGIIYLYATKSGKRYETTDASVTEMKYITGDIEVLSYVDVTYSTDLHLGSYRVKYYSDGKVVALRSYNEGDQLEFLAGIDKMLFESIEEGSGVRRICEIVPDLTKSTIEFSPIVYSSNTGKESDYKVLINETLYPTFVNVDNKDEVMISSFNLKTNDTVRITNKNGVAIDMANFDPYSTKDVSFSNGIITAKTNGLFDLYYNFKTNTVYIAQAVVYEVVLFNGDTEVGAYKMYPNPSAMHPGEVMAIGVEVENGITAKVRRVSGVEFLPIVLNSTEATLSGNTISFSKGDNYDFFLYTNDTGINVYVGGATVDNFTANYPNTTTNSVTPIDPTSLPTINFVNDIYGYNNGYITRVYYLNSKGEFLVDSDENAYVFEFKEDIKEIPVIDGAYKLRILRYKENTNVEINEVTVNAIYPGKTLTLSTPYYGYYDISYSSDITDQTGLFVENLQNAQAAYLNYVLNDGRIGHIQMELNEGKFYVPFDSVIGLNPVKVSFTLDLLTTEYIDLQYLNGDTLYEIHDNEAVIIGSYSTFNRVDLYVDETLPEWDDYFILSNGVYYEMNKAATVTIGKSKYAMYVAYVKGDTYQVTSDPSYTTFFSTIEFTYSSFMMSATDVGFDFSTMGEESEVLEEYTYKYYLQSQTPGLLPTIGLVENNGAYFGFYDLGEEVTYYVVDSINSTTPLSEMITSDAGRHVIIYYEEDSTIDVYRNELTYTVNAFYNGYKDRRVYSMGEIVQSPDESNISSTNKYTFTFVGWKYNGKTYLVEEDTKYLYYLNENQEKVYLHCVSAMTITPVYEQTIKTFKVTLVNHDGVVVGEKEYNYGQKVSSIDIATPNYPTINGKTYTAKDSKFVGWYIDSEKRIIAHNFAITEDTTLYAKWNLKGVFLVGVIEGYQDWDDQKDGYMFEDLGTSGADHFVLEDVYLEAGDIVKPREFKISDDDYWFGDWESYEGGAYVKDTNLHITKSGYYSFYIQQYAVDDGVGKQKIFVTYKQYMVSYEFDKKTDLIDGTVHNYPNYRFNLPYESNGITYNKFPIISEEDHRMNEGLIINSPSLQKIVDGQLYVVKGWYTRPVNGERVTEVDTTMLVYRNSITLYPVYILGGHYLVEDGIETYLGRTASDDLNALPKYNKGDKIRINYYNGSTYTADGVSTLDPSKVDLSETTATISGYDIVITQDGIYDLYQDENGILHVVQYHEVIYRYDIRVTPQLYGNSIGPNIVYIQKYKEALATVANPNIENANGVKVVFIGWTLSGSNTKPDYGDESRPSNQIVTGNQTFDVVYRVDSFNDK